MEWGQYESRDFEFPYLEVIFEAIGIDTIPKKKLGEVRDTGMGNS